MCPPPRPPHRGAAQFRAQALPGRCRRAATAHTHGLLSRLANAHHFLTCGGGWLAGFAVHLRTGWQVKQFPFDGAFDDRRPFSALLWIRTQPSEQPRGGITHTHSSHQLLVDLHYIIMTFCGSAVGRLTRRCCLVGGSALTRFVPRWVAGRRLWEAVHSEWCAADPVRQRGGGGGGGGGGGRWTARQRLSRHLAPVPRR